jgi:hypothetical protein
MLTWEQTMEDRTSAALFIEDFAEQRCFDQDQYSAYFLSPSQFRTVAAWVGSVRAQTYRRVSPHGPAEVDLDGRDAHYWHLLVLDRDRQSLAGSLRLSLSSWHGQTWDGRHSYLEHCYPGLDQWFRDRGETYAEIGRTFVAPPYQRTSPVLIMLLRAMASLPLATGHSQLLGMVSYNHFQHSTSLRQRFLSEILHPPFGSSLHLPDPRHPFPSIVSADEKVSTPIKAESLGQLERALEETFQEPFRVPLLLRKYMAFGNARVVGLSLARDFNQICEILMHCDLNGLKPQQRDIFVIDDLRPVWNNQRLGESPS